MNSLAPKLVLALAAALGADALGASVVLSQLSGSMTLQSGTLAPQALASPKNGWSASSLLAAHAAFNTSGIATNGKVTIATADLAQGTMFLVLIDEQLASTGSAVAGRLQMSTIAEGSQLAYANNQTALISSRAQPGVRTARAAFDWNSNGEGAGFAWLNLAPGSKLKFQFTRDPDSSGLDAASTFQFVTWDGGSWQRMDLPSSQTSFSETGEFAFTAAVAVPLPTTFAFAGVPLLGLLLRRTR